MDGDGFLIELLGAADSVFAPLRAPGWDADGWPSFRREHIASYQYSGIPWEGGGDSAARSRRQRLVESFADAGTVVRGPSTATRLNVGLTPEGERRARALVGWNADDFEKGHDILRRLRRSRTERPETDFTSGDWGDDGTAGELADLQVVLLPLYFRRWIDSTSTIRGHVFLAVTDAGREALKGDPLAELADDAAPLERGGELYSRAVNHHRRRLRKLAASSARWRQEILIPRSMSR